jgi:predicted aspartyl protease
LFAGVASAQQQSHTFRVQFHSVDDLILLDVNVNGKPAVMLLDTGANVTLLRHAPANAVAVEIEPSRAVTVTALDLEKVKVHLAKRDMERIDGLLGQDFLRYFSSVRIDYRTKTIELEQ